MIRYKLNVQGREVLVSLDSELPNKVAPLRYEGDTSAVFVVKRWLTYEIGFDGREIADWAAPLDLKKAMKADRAKPFAPELVEESVFEKHRAKAGAAEGGG